MLYLLIKGLVIGFAVAAPVGPIGILCIRNTLNKGRLSGLATGLGAATADALYGCIAAFGLTIISNFLLGQTTVLKVLGGAFLLYIGITTCIKKAEAAFTSTNSNRTSLLKDYSMTFMLTLSNPLTILSFVAIIASAGTAQKMTVTQSVSTVFGVFCGSALWWAALSFITGFLKKRINALYINYISGTTICLFAVWSLLSALK